MYFKISKICVLIPVFACIISSCKKDREQENESYESYRYELWKNLVDNNYNFDFVGRPNYFRKIANYSVIS